MRATLGRSSGTSAGTQLDWFICPSLVTTVRLDRMELRTIANSDRTAQKPTTLTNRAIGVLATTGGHVRLRRNLRLLGLVFFRHSCQRAQRSADNQGVSLGRR